jgi:hypothetical protein
MEATHGRDKQQGAHGAVSISRLYLFMPMFRWACTILNTTLSVMTLERGVVLDLLNLTACSHTETDEEYERNPLCFKRTLILKWIDSPYRFFSF